MRIVLFSLLLFVSCPSDAEWMQPFIISKCVKELPYFEISMGKISAPEHIFQQDGNVIPKIKTAFDKQGVQLFGKESSYICSLPSYKVRVDLNKRGYVSISINDKLIIDQVSFNWDDPEECVVHRIDLNLSDNADTLSIQGVWKLKDDKYRERDVNLSRTGIIDASRLCRIMKGLE